VTAPEVVRPLRIADAKKGVRHLFVHDLVLPSRVGVHQHERENDQPVRINVDLSVAEGEEPTGDRITDVVCYEGLIDGIRRIISAGHVTLVETLAENIADMCLGDARVLGARVRIEKLNIFPEAAGVGVEIERVRQ
jgi:dihydroneopterin aldolase